MADTAPDSPPKPGDDDFDPTRSDQFIPTLEDLASNWMDGPERGTPQPRDPDHSGLLTVNIPSKPAEDGNEESTSKAAANELEATPGAGELLVGVPDDVPPAPSWGSKEATATRSQEVQASQGVQTGPFLPAAPRNWGAIIAFSAVAAAVVAGVAGFAMGRFGEEGAQGTKSPAGTPVKGEAAADPPAQPNADTGADEPVPTIEPAGAKADDAPDDDDAATGGMLVDSDEEGPGTWTAKGVELPAKAVGYNGTLTRFQVGAPARGQSCEFREQLSISRDRKAAACYVIDHPEYKRRLSVLWKYDGEVKRRSLRTPPRARQLRAQGIMLLADQPTGTWTVELALPNGVVLASTEIEVVE